jgi:hypothetical protein
METFINPLEGYVNTLERVVQLYPPTGRVMASAN